MSIDPVSTMGALVEPPSGRDLDRKSPKEAAQQFERMLIGQLLDQVPIPGMEGTQAGAFLSMVHDAMAEQIVSSGGLGLADELERAMSRQPGVPAPRPGNPAVTSGFGYRSDPIDHTRKFHDGVDLSAPAGSPIRAAEAGTVTFAGRSGGYGNLVIVDHGGGLETRYAHCAQLDVHAGEAVAAGQALATVGSTGRSTGPHLHFEVRKDGIPMDPNDDRLATKPLGETIRGGEREATSRLGEGDP